MQTPTTDNPTSPGFDLPALIEQAKNFSEENPWVKLVAAVIVIFIIGKIVFRLLKSLKHSAITSSHGSQIKKTLSNFQIGTADVIPGSTSTVVEITNSTNLPFTVTHVTLMKNQKPFPLKLPYKGRISPPRTLPKNNELHNGPAQMKSQDTFVFGHPVNAFFILNDKESFTVVIDAVFNAEGRSEKLRFTSSTLKKKHLQAW